MLGTRFKMTILEPLRTVALPRGSKRPVRAPDRKYRPGLIRPPSFAPRRDQNEFVNR
jgi:hypothetical protein